MADPELHVKINSLICEGTAYCVRINPDVFGIGTDGLGEVLVDRPAPEFEDSLEEAATLCPTRAITY
ncbi:MAG: ferredoxin [Acidimicrobiaceae bacterium]|nr:ferredoxin [Acidimicrobiaceae bacterium]|tara:strand:- start:26 stop:226 length:201 start_codon:yes stop_codon:yes gene_type:complete